MTMKTLITIFAFSLSLTAFAQDSIQRIQMDTSKNCLTLRNGKVILLQNGKATPLKQDTTLPNGTKITVLGRIIPKNGAKTEMKTGECFNYEGTRMTNAEDKKKTAM